VVSLSNEKDNISDASWMAERMHGMGRREEEKMLIVFENFQFGVNLKS